MKNLKRLYPVFAAVFALSLAFVSCSDPTNDTTPVPPPVLPGKIAISPDVNVTVEKTLTAVYSESEDGLTYQWNKDGTPVSVAVNKTYTPASAGIYTVTVNKEGYTGITSAAVTITDGVSVNYDTLADDLSGVTGGDSAGSPVTVKLNAITISNANTPAAPAIGWGEIDAAIKTARKYIVIDLSACSFTDNTVSGSYPPAANDMNVINGNYYIKGVILPESVTTIDDYAFHSGSGLTSITIPAGVTSIGQAAFYGCTGLTSVTIPGSVTSMGENAFSNCARLTSVTISSGVTVIGNNAFYNCTGLTSVTIPGSVTSIGERAFYRCTGLTSVTIPEGVTSIGEYAFYRCTGLTSVIISGGVTAIGEYAFYGCTGLTGVIIPGSVTSIGGSAFYGCTGLTSVTFRRDDTVIATNAFPYSEENGATDTLKTVYDGEGGGAGTYTRPADTDDWTKSGNADPDIPLTGTIAISRPAGSVYVGMSLSAVYTGGTETDISYQWNKDGTAISGANETTYTPESAGSYTVTVSKEGSISKTSAAVIVSVPAPSLKTLADDLSGVSGDSAAAPVTVELAETLISTANPAPAESTGWAEINAILDAAKKYVVLDLSECSFTNNTVTGYSSPANNHMNIIHSNEYLKGIILPSGLTSIGEEAFRGCSGLTGVSIPESVTAIAGYAFYGCTGLTSVTIPGSVASIEYGAFYGCSGLTSVTIPEDVTNIKGNAFYDCTGLTSVTIPEGVTVIGNNTFNGCTGLTGVTIPASVTTIAMYAFRYCNGLTNVTFMGSDVIISQAFPGSATLEELYTANGAGTYTRSAGADANDWVKSGNGDPDTLPVNYETLADDLSSLTGDSAGSPVTVKLNAITISNAAEPGEGETGWGEINSVIKTAEKYVVIDLSACSFTDNAVTGSYAPYANDMSVIKDNEYVKGVILPEGVTTIGNDAFYECARLASVTIPGSVASIGQGAFFSCGGLTSVTISSGVDVIGKAAFYGCGGLTAITIPASVTSIVEEAFLYCNGLTSVTFMGTGASIGANAFPYSASGSSDTLKTAYVAGGAGTYMRTIGADNWAKQP